jgi:hypothetical protein
VVAFTTWYDMTWPQAPRVPGSRYSSASPEPIINKKKIRMKFKNDIIISSKVMHRN